MLVFNRETCRQLSQVPSFHELRWFRSQQEGEGTRSRRRRRDTSGATAAPAKDLPAAACETAALQRTLAWRESLSNISKSPKADDTDAGDERLSSAATGAEASFPIGLKEDTGKAVRIDHRFEVPWRA